MNVAALIVENLAFAIMAVPAIGLGAVGLVAYFLTRD